MALPFFRALNPMSHKSGIEYALAPGHECQYNEMRDMPSSWNFSSILDPDYGYLEQLDKTYLYLIGEHYDLYIKGSKKGTFGGAKGALDYLIFPLVARKLIADTFLPERRESHFLNTMAIMVAIPLEIARFSAAFALTLLLAPVIAVLHLIIQGLNVLCSNDCSNHEKLKVSP
jgi:hypothetical protein